MTPSANKVAARYLTATADNKIPKDILSKVEVAWDKIYDAEIAYLKAAGWIKSGPSWKPPVWVNNPSETYTRVRALQITKDAQPYK
jgi:hypothetical protein